TAAGVVTGKQTGTGNVGAQLDGMNATLSISITDAVPAHIAVSPDNVTVAQGQTTPIQVFATLTNNDLADVTSVTTWTMANPLVALVTNGPDGAVVQGVSAGTTYLTATVYTGATVQSTNVPVTVYSKSLTSIQIVPDPITLQLGASLSLTALGEY